MGAAQPVTHVQLACACIGGVISSSVRRRVTPARSRWVVASVVITARGQSADEPSAAGEEASAAGSRLASARDDVAYLTRGRWLLQTLANRFGTALTMGGARVWAHRRDRRSGTDQGVVSASLDAARGWIRTSG